ncbi:hypothetical protein RJT34_10187 [Clitoria ternatea]|uniref:Uncharacterized protein n=1 Tax=Clitoria ternatea TaxID=43366 RepID=A0AAN9K9Q5_CLITE
MRLLKSVSNEIKQGGNKEPVGDDVGHGGVHAAIKDEQNRNVEDEHEGNGQQTEEDIGAGLCFNTDRCTSLGEETYGDIEDQLSTNTEINVQGEAVVDVATREASKTKVATTANVSGPPKVTSVVTSVNIITVADMSGPTEQVQRRRPSRPRKNPPPDVAATNSNLNEAGAETRKGRGKGRGRGRGRVGASN